MSALHQLHHYCIYFPMPPPPPHHLTHMLKYLLRITCEKRLNTCAEFSALSLYSVRSAVKILRWCQGVIHIFLHLLHFLSYVLH
ncbi:hypothetical protein LDENG_00088710 [Lucifuga dentata]|nr:hypothetical protein LDENG_00088710 [Lucifuga dentata]